MAPQRAPSRMPTIPRKRHAPFMLTTDLALRMDPIYGPISKRFYEHPQEFADAFAKAWFKLTHRDMGPISRYLGPLVPKEPQLWQDPVPAVDHKLIGEKDIAALKAKVLASGLSISQLVSTAWAAAASFRGSDKRGGANGARIRSHATEGLGGKPTYRIGEGSQEIRSDPKRVQRFPIQQQQREEGLAGDPAVEEAAKRAGHNLKVPFSPGRTDASPAQTDVFSFAALEPQADGFRNYVRKGASTPVEELLVDRAQLLTLTAPEMAVLIGGLRVLNANHGQTKHGVFTKRPETLTNDFFVNLLDINTKWQASSTSEGVFEGRDRVTGKIKWTATRVDLVFGSNSQLRAIAEVYASDDSKQAFVKDFVAAWSRVMNLDRFDLA